MTERNVQQEEILSAATRILVKAGYQKTTTLAIATECGISKNTLYRHFASKEELFVTLIKKRTQTINQRLDAAIDDQSLAIEDALKQFGNDVLAILTSDISLALNRAAISAAATQDLELTKAYMQYGRGPTKRRVKAMLERARAKGSLAFDDSDRALHDLLGLLQGDQHIEQLLGASAPANPQKLAEQVDRAVTQYLKLYGV